MQTEKTPSCYLGTSCPEVSACDEAPQSIVEIVQLIHQPLRDGWDAIGRDQKGKDKEHDPAQRLAADEQGHSKQGQHHTGQNENGSCHAEQKRHHGGQNGEHHHKGGGKDFQNDHKRLPPVKVDGFPPTNIITPTIYANKDVDGRATLGQNVPNRNLHTHSKGPHQPVGAFTI